jgi:CRISPR/Cas system-associated protein Csm6
MEVDPIIIPIEIRPGYFVQIMGIPHDLTAEEAEKIAAVVLAMAQRALSGQVQP